MSPRLRPRDVLAAAGVDPDPLPLLDEERHLDDYARLEGGRLGAAAGGGVTLEARVRLTHSQVHCAGGLGAGWALVDKEKVDVGVGRHPPQSVADDRLRYLDLVVALIVHEDGGIARVVEELHLARLGAHRTELLPGLERLVDHRPVADPLELRAHEGAALAGLDVLELHDPEDGTPDLDVGAVPELVGADHGREG